MRFRSWAMLLCTIPLVLIDTTTVQASNRASRELYILCARSPHNSRCQGQDWPTLMQDRPGVAATCSILRGDFDEATSCKIHVQDNSLVIYREIGDPIPELDNQQDTTEIEIPANQILAFNTRLWSSRGDGLFTVWSARNRANLTLTYMSSHEDVAYRSNVLTLFTDAETGATLTQQLNQLAPPTRPESLLSQLTNSPSSALSGTAAINQLEETGDCPRCDLRNADLSNANLDEANLEGANLEGANLTGADLSEAYLIGANLDRANLVDADLSQTRLTLATLMEANLQQAKLESADLQWANLQSAVLTESRAGMSVLQGANLAQANLSQANLEGVNLIQANLEGANLTAANLSDKSLTNSVAMSPAYSLLFGSSTTYHFVTDLSNANLRNANLTGANLEDVIAQDTDLSGANLSNINLEDTNLSGANLCGAMMPDGASSNQGC